MSIFARKSAWRDALGGSNGTATSLTGNRAPPWSARTRPRPDALRAGIFDFVVEVTCRLQWRRALRHPFGQDAVPGPDDFAAQGVPASGPQSIIALRPEPCTHFRRRRCLETAQASGLDPGKRECPRPEGPGFIRRHKALASHRKSRSFRPPPSLAWPPGRWPGLWDHRTFGARWRAPLRYV